MFSFEIIKYMRKLELVDTTFRDGQQSPLLFDTHKYKFNLEERKLLIRGLINLGIRYFEFFSPVVSSTEAEHFKALKSYVENELKIKDVRYIAHCRVNKTDIDLAIKAGFNGLNLYIGTSRNSTKHNHGKSIKEIKDQSTEIIQKLRQSYPELYIRFSGEDAFRTKLSDLFSIYDNLKGLVNTFGMPDTVGCATPSTVQKVTSALKKRYPKVNLETHFHNDRGLALVNTVEAVKCGAKYVDTSVWGIAERSGINSTTGTLLNLYIEDNEFVNGYSVENSYPLNVLMGSILNMQVPYTEPISLTNRTHIAGVHTGAVLKNPEVYENIDLSIFGVNNKHLLLGPLSGWNIIQYYLKEVLYFNCSPEQAKEITSLFKKQVQLANKYNKPHVILESIASNYPLERMTTEINRTFTNRLENLS